MSNASSFLAGMASGYIAEGRRQEDNMRQDKLAIMREEEFALRKRSLENQLTEQDLSRENKAKERQLVTDLGAVNDDVRPVSTFSYDVAGKTPAQIEEVTQKMSTGENTGTQTIEVGAGTNRQTFLAGAQGIADSKKYANSLNDPRAKSVKTENLLRRYGKYDQADVYRQKWDANQVNIEKAQLDVITNYGLNEISQGNMYGLSDAYNKHFKDDRTSVYEPGAGTAGAFIIYQGDPKDGKRVGEMRFKDRDEAASQFVSALYPKAAYDQRQTNLSEQAKSANSDKTFALREIFKSNLINDRTSARTGEANANRPDKPAKAEKTGKERALSAVEDKYKNELDPSALTRVRNFVSTSYDLDPSIDDIQRVLAAEEAGARPETVTPRLLFGAQAGIAATHTNAATGAKTPLHKISSQYVLTEQDRKGLKADVSAYIDAENKRMTGFGNVLLAAAKGEKTALVEANRMFAAKIEQDLIARKPFPPGMPVAEKVKAMAALHELAMGQAKKNLPLIENSIGMIRTYGLK